MDNNSISSSSSSAEYKQEAANKELLGLTNDIESISVNEAPTTTCDVITDENGIEWLDITAQIDKATEMLDVGELIKAQSFSLYDALVSIQMMDPRLDMGMLVHDKEERDCSQWSMDQPLMASQALWIIDRIFCCEMTWHDSTMLLQTIYTCRYFTKGNEHLPSEVGNAKVSKNPVRDLVLFPILVAVGKCCRLVWSEYMRGNLYSNEDTYFGTFAAKFFDQFSLNSAIELLETAETYLTNAFGKDKDAEINGSSCKINGHDSNASMSEFDSAQILLGYINIRRHWLNVLSSISIDYLIEDPSALSRGMAELDKLKKTHNEFVSKYKSLWTSGNDGHIVDVGTVVPGAFDKRSMRHYPSLGPIKPIDPKSQSEAHALMSRLIDGLGLIKELLDVESVETLMYLFMEFSRHDPTHPPFIRSLMISVLTCEGRIQLMQPMSAFVHRSIKEFSGMCIWDNILEPPTKGDGDTTSSTGSPLHLSLLSDEELKEARSRMETFTESIVQILVDWFRLYCQNLPRQRRIAIKYLPTWDVIQGNAEDLDTYFYLMMHPEDSRNNNSNSAEHNPFWISSWAYHLKLILLEQAAVLGIRCNVYLPYEFPIVFCYITQVFEAHYAHLMRTADILKKQADSEYQYQHKTVKNGVCNSGSIPWTLRRVRYSECLANIERWKLIILAQKDLATSTWLVSHCIERLGVFKAPWARRKDSASLKICKYLESKKAQYSRYSLRFRTSLRLLSPSPMTFDDWLDTTQQIDDYKIINLFLHTQKLLLAVKRNLEVERKAILKFSDVKGGDRYWDRYYKALYSIVLSNSINLNHVVTSSYAGIKDSPLGILGSLAVKYRDVILDDSIGKLANNNESLSSPISSPVVESQHKNKVKKSPKTKRNKSKKGNNSKRTVSGSEEDNRALIRDAKQWMESVRQMLEDKNGLVFEWSCVSQRHPNWPVFSFQN